MLFILIYVLYKLYKSKLLTLRTIGYSCCMRMSIVIGPKGSFYSCDDILDCLGQVYAGTVFGYSTNETLPDFLKWRRVTRHPLVFRGLTGSQQTPEFWGVTAWYQSLGIRVPRELGFGYPSPLGGLMWSIGM